MLLLYSLGTHHSVKKRAIFLSREKSTFFRDFLNFFTQDLVYGVKKPEKSDTNTTCSDALRVLDKLHTDGRHILHLGRNRCNLVKDIRK